MQVRQGCRSSPEKARPDDMCRIYGSLSVFAKNVNKSLSFIYILQLSPTSTACQALRVRVFHQLPFNTKIQQLHGEQSLIKEAQTSHPLYTKNAMQKKPCCFFAKQARCSLFSATKPQPLPWLSLSLFPPPSPSKKKQKTKSRTPQQKINRFTAAVWAVQNVILGNAEMKLVTQKVTEYKL